MRYHVRRRRSTHTSLRNQKRDPIRVKFLESLCEFDATTTCLPLDLGIRVYVEYIEHCMLESYMLLEDFFHSVSTRAETDKLKLERYVDITVTVVTLCRNIKTQTSINDIARNLFIQYGVPSDAAAHHLNAAYQAIFACVGWTSMMFSPITDQSRTEFCFSQQTRGSTVYRRVSDTAKRPIGAMIRGFGVVPLQCPPRIASTPEETPLLAVSNLNFFVLSKLGDLSVAWVDDLTSHCKLDLGKKELALFRFPSFCSHIYRSKSDTMIGWYVESYS